MRAAETAVVRTGRPHHRPGRGRPACPTGWRDRALATFRALAEAEGRLHRRAPDAGPLPRGRRPRRHRRRRRDLRRPRGARRRRGLLRPGRDRDRDGPGRARRAAQPGAGGRRPAARAHRSRASTCRSSWPPRPAPPCSPPWLAGWGPLPAMRDRHGGFGAGSRELDGRPNVTQVVVGTAAAAAPARSAPGPASPWCCSRPTSTTPPARCSPTPWRRCWRPAPTTPGSRRS